MDMILVDAALIANYNPKPSHLDTNQLNLRTDTSGASFFGMMRRVSRIEVCIILDVHVAAGMRLQQRSGSCRLLEGIE